MTLKIIARNESLLNSILVNRRKSLYWKLLSFLGSEAMEVSEIREIIQRDRETCERFLIKEHLSVIVHPQCISRFPSKVLFYRTIFLFILTTSTAPACPFKKKE